MRGWYFLMIVTLLLTGCRVEDRQFTTYIPSEGIGDIAVRVTLPDEPRYKEGAPVVVYTPTFFTPENKFGKADWVNEQGFILVEFIWPGIQDPQVGVKSDGTFDYGGEDSMQAFRDVILFALNEKKNTNDEFLSDISYVEPLSDNVGLYAFSHPGIAATNVLAFYSEELENVKYFVGRENPTIDKLSSVEVGQFEGDKKILNPYYHYSEDYSSSDLSINYSTVHYDFSSDTIYFDANGNGKLDSLEYVLGERVPQMFGKRFYSTDLTQALLDNDALNSSTWPEDLATVDDTKEVWPLRETPESYPALAGSDIHVMLVFAETDHVQPARDKPHIHQAYDGFTDAGLWVRLNPDSVYVAAVSQKFSDVVPDNVANTEPSEWNTIEDWAYPNVLPLNLVPQAAIDEMADRVYTNTWDDDLTSVLVK